MSDWGEDDYEPQDAGSSSTTAAAPAGGRAFGIDVGGLADELVDAAVKSLVRKEVSAVAADAVKDALTDDVLDALRARAETAAAAAIAAQLENSGLDEGTAADVPDAAESVLTYGVGGRMVEVRRGGDPSRSALALLGVPAPRSLDRYECVVA